MFYIILLISISTILSYLILKFIYRILFKSKKKVSKFLVFIGSIGLIIFYYTPYSFYLEPSFWQFKKMCKLNELPNNEEKYNKILSYFDLSLDTLDYDKLDYNMKHPVSIHPIDKVFLTKPNEVMVAELSKNRYYIKAIFSSKDSHNFSYRNIIQADLFGHWHARRYFPDGNEGSGFYWSEGTLDCGYIVKENEG